MMKLTNRFTSAGLPLLLNHAMPERPWIHIVPKGELPNAEAGVVQVLDEIALNRIVQNLAEDAKNPNWTGLYGGEEHFIYNSDKSSEAFMWGREFELRADGIWTRGDMTDIGATALKNKRFKFTSFVTDPGVAGSVEPLGGNKVRVNRIDTFGFTNFANGRHLLTPITNKETLSPAEPGVTADEKAGIQNQRRNTMKQIATKLGLSADASEDAILGELTKLENRATTAEAKVTPLTEERDKLKNRLTTIEGEAIDTEIAAAGIKDTAVIGQIKPFLGTLKNREERSAFLATMKPAAQVTTTKPITNRTTAKTPGQQPAPEGKEEVTAQQLDTEVRKIMNRDGLKFEPAFNKLRTEQPALFGAE